MAVITGSPTVDVQAFTIAEQTGDQRTLVLTQRALPYRPIEFSGEQRAEFTTYAGNPIKTMQVLGAEEEPSEMSGFWKDRFIGETTGSPQTSMAYYTKQGQQTSLLTVVDLAELVDDMRRKGQRVVVQWGPIVRRGLIKRFTQKWHNVHDMEWTIRFEWTDQNDPDVPAVMAQDTDYANAQGTLQAQLQTMQETVDDASDDVDPSQVESLAAVISNLSDTVQQFTDTVTSATDNITPILDQQRRLASILGSIASDCDTITAEVTSAPSVSFVPAGIPTTEIGGPTLAVDIFNRTLLDNARDMKYGALTAQYNLFKSINPNVLAMFTARADTDLRDVSTTYYGTQDEWRSLMAFNGLPDSTLYAGDTVFVPQLYRPLDGGGAS